MSGTPPEGGQYLARLPALARRLGQLLQDNLFASDAGTESPLLEGEHSSSLALRCAGRILSRGLLLQLDQEMMMKCPVTWCCSDSGWLPPQKAVA